MKTTRDMLPWTPFQRGVLKPQNLDDVKAIADSVGIDPKDALSAAEDVNNDEIWINSKYQVNIRRYLAESGLMVAHLSIKRRDKMRVGPEKYRDFMRIKDELIGPECEAIELYPARSREVDTANQYHLFAATDPAYRFPVGFSQGIRSGESTGGAVQQPFETP